MKILSTLFFTIVISFTALAQSNYDVKFYKIDLNVTNTTTVISGSVEMKAKATITNLSQIVLDLSSALIVDSVKVSSTKCTNSLSGDKLTITLPSLIQKNAYFTTIIYYHGSGSVGTSFPAGMANGSFGPQKYTYTLSEPYFSYLWWPCKQDLSDKADSAYIFITTEATNKVAANGLLTKTVSGLPNSKTRYEWKTRYPIEYYLIAFSAGPYTEYTTYANPVGATSSIKIQDFLYSTAYINSNKSVLDQTKLLIEKFSDLFGMYPFKNEKYGHFSAPCNLGALENQTMTMMPGFDFDIVAHELTHQWYGDNVTCASWQDIWLNEGFATYGEYLANEYLVSKSAALGIMATKHTKALVADGSSYVAVGSLSNPMAIFDDALSYDKGASILHMLRFEVGDSVFFKILKDYHSKYAGKTASTDSLTSVVNLVSKGDYTNFFNQWVYGYGYPNYTFSSHQNGDSLYITSNQSGSSVNTSLFKMKLDFKIKYQDGTDTVVAYQKSNAETFKFVIPGRTAKTIYCNPNKWSLMSTSNIGDSVVVQQMTSSIDARELQRSKLLVYPNPFSEETNVSFDLAEDGNVEIALYSAYGTRIAIVDSHKRAKGANTFSLNAAEYGLTTGLYFIRITTPKQMMYSKVEVIR